MTVDFFPALNWTTRVHGGVAAQIGHDRDRRGIAVVFTARMSDADYAAVRRTGQRIEVWTDAPRRAGSVTTTAGPALTSEWAAFPFEEVREREEEEDGREGGGAQVGGQDGHGAAGERDVGGEAGEFLTRGGAPVWGCWKRVRTRAWRIWFGYPLQDRRQGSGRAR